MVVMTPARRPKIFRGSLPQSCPEKEERMRMVMKKEVDYSKCNVGAKLRK